MFTAVSTVPVQFKNAAIKEIERRIEKHRKKLVKWGVEGEISIVVSDPCKIDFQIDRDTIINLNCVTITVHYPEAKLPGGWNLRCKIERNKHLNVITGEDESFRDYVQGEIECEHCRKPRKRKWFYGLESEAGERIVVGTSCAKDFIGHNISSMERYINYVLDQGQERWEVGASYRMAKVIPAERFIKQFIINYSSMPYLTAKQAGYGQNPSTVEFFMYATENRNDPNFGVIKDSDKELLKKYERMMSDFSEFQSGIKEKIKNGLTDSISAFDSALFNFLEDGLIFLGSNDALIISSIYYYFMNYNRKRIAAEYNESFAGKVGEQYTGRVIIERVTASEGYYGASYGYIMKDESGHRIVYWTSGSTTAKRELDLKYDNEEQFVISGKIKKTINHPRYGHQTILNRAFVKRD